MQSDFHIAGIEPSWDRIEIDNAGSNAASPIPASVYAVDDLRWRHMLAQRKCNLFLGDNLAILRDHNRIRTESVDLVYLDPPFKSDKKYNVLFTEADGTRAAAQQLAFKDTWSWDQESAALFHEVVEAGGNLSNAMQSFHKLFGGGNTMLAYLTMMAPRLVEMKRAMKKGASIYLHCDSAASHYLKVLMDAIFGPECFRNEIIWSYRRWPSPSKHFQRMHDVLLFYVKDRSGPDTFNVKYEPNSPSYEKRFKGMTQVLDPESRTRKLTVDKPSRGLPMRDVWDIKIIPGSGKERLGYPTQKPEALLQRIIEVSTNKGDVVLDPFCGCGTSISVADDLGRSWIGIDITHLAIAVVRHRLGPRAKFEFDGDPPTLSEARALAQLDPYKFQFWAVGKVCGFPLEQRRGADKGIDGRIAFHDEPVGSSSKEIIISVKSGKTNVSHVRDLRGVLDREKAAIGVLITLEPPTQPMISEAMAAGFYQSIWWRTKHPKLQILTAEEMLAGKGIDYPNPTETFVSPKKRVASVDAPEQMRLLKM